MRTKLSLLLILCLLMAIPVSAQGTAYRLNGGVSTNRPGNCQSVLPDVFVDTDTGHLRICINSAWVDFGTGGGGGGGTPGGSTTQVQYNNAGAFAGISGLTSNGTNVTAGSGNLRATLPWVTTGINDANGNVMFSFTPTASAVNGFTFINSIGTTAVELQATGTGAAIPFKLTPKGAAGVILPSGTAAAPAISSTGFGATTSGLWFAGAGNTVYYSSAGTSKLAMSGTMFEVSSDDLVSWNNGANVASGSTDTGIGRVSAGVLEINAAAAGTNAALLFGENVVPKTTNYTVVAANKNTFFTNTGAAGEVDYTLPTAAAGLTYVFYVDAAQTVKVIASGSATIRIGTSVSAANGNATNAATGSIVRLTAISTTQWVAEFVQGTWTVT